MAVFNVVKIGDAVLRQECKAVPKINDSILRLLTNMADTMYAAEGVGLAAPQIGIAKRVVVIDVGDGLLEMINPEIIEYSPEMEMGEEGCLSVPGRWEKVPRHSSVVVRYLNRNGEIKEEKLDGFKARAAQHEVDHLDGILFIDHIPNS